MKGVAWAWSSLGSVSITLPSVREPEAVGVGGKPFGVLCVRPNSRANVAGKVTRRRGLAGRVADPPDRELLAELAAGRHQRRRPGEVAHVQPVEARAVARVGALAHLDDVLAVLRAR